jgi:hypothetical protein
MAKERGQVREGRLKRQRSRLCEGPRYESKTATTGGRLKARLFLRKDEWHEEKVNVREDRKRSKLSD